MVKINSGKEKKTENFFLFKIYYTILEIACALFSLSEISIRISHQLMVIAFNISSNFRFVVIGDADIGAVHRFFECLIDACCVREWSELK